MTIDNRDRQEFGTGYNHGFVPLESLDINKIDDADGLLRAMSKTAFGGRTLGDAADVLYDMVTDPDCFTVMTLSGAMTVAKMGLLATEMIDRGMIHAVVSTGALTTHGLVENAGMTHFKYDFSKTDLELSNAHHHFRCTARPHKPGTQAAGTSGVGCIDISRRCSRSDQKDSPGESPPASQP